MSDFCLIKYNEVGQQLWNRTWGGSRYDSAMDVAVDSNDNVYIAGSYHYYVAGESQGGDMAVVKYDSSGNQIWERVFGGSNDDDCYALTIDSNDNIYLAGTRDQQPNDDFLVVKYDSSGILKWSRVFGGQFPDKCSDVAVDSNGNVYLVGDTNSFGTPGWFNFLIVKYNPYGTQLWYKAWGGSSDDHAYDIVIDSSNNIYVAGLSGAPDQITIVKFSNSGTYQWHKAWRAGSYFKDEWYDSGAIVMDDKDLIYITSSSKTLWVYNTSGDLQWSLDYLSSGIGTCSGLSFDSHGNLYFGGKKKTIYNALCLVKYKIQTPKIEILSPLSNTLYGIIPPEFELSIYEPDLNSTWYSLNNGVNYTFPNPSGFIDQIAWDACGNGTVIIRFYVNNSDEDIAFEEVTLRKDIMNPEISIISPINNEVFGLTPPKFEVSINEPNLDTTWYSLNDGVNITFSSPSGFIDQAAWDTCGNGTVSIIFYVKDEADNEGSAQVIIRKEATPPLITIISPKENEFFHTIAPTFEIAIQETDLNTTWYTLDDSVTKFIFPGLTSNIDQAEWDKYDDASIVLKFYANDSYGFENFAQIIVHKDINAPIITINSPQQDEIFSSIAPAFDITVIDSQLDSMWYTIDDGLINITIISTVGTIDQTEWDQKGEGYVPIRFYANDTLGNTAYSEVVIIKDTIQPIISINFPSKFEVFGNEAPFFSLSIIEPNLDAIWYTLDGGITNIGIVSLSGTIDQTEWNKFGNGTVTIQFYARDLAGSIGFSQVVVLKDIIAPSISINSPNEDDIFGYIAPSFTLSIVETNIDAMWYTLDSGITNYSIVSLSGTINQNEWDALPNGPVTIRFYAKDKAGNEGMSQIIIHKDIAPPIVIINSPQQDEIISSIAPAFNITVFDFQLDSMWYTIDNGLTNITIISTVGTIDQTEWDQKGEGYVPIRFYANDTLGNTAYSEVVIIKDTIQPIISINFPSKFEVFGNEAPFFSLSIIEPNLDAIWYTLDGGITNIGIVSLSGTIDQTEWNKFGNGTVTIQFYARDLAGSIGFSQVVVLKDIIAPSISINSPNEDDIFGYIAPSFTLSIIETNLDAVWYSLNGGTNITFTGPTGKLNQALWDALPEGSVVIRFYAKDSIGNIGFAEVTIKKDVTAPIITINNPQNNDASGATAPSFDISIDEPNLDTVWYSLNGGTNITFTGLTIEVNQALWDALPEGSVVIRFYANDTLGNIAYSEVVIIKDVITPEISINTPNMFEVFGDRSPSFSLSIIESNLDAMWYTLDGGITNYSIVSLSGTINQAEWNKYGNGTVIIQFYTSDLAGNIGVSQIIVHKDVSLPLITIISPVMSEFVSPNAPHFELSIQEPNIDLMWYTLDYGATNIYFSDLTGAIDQLEWDKHGNGSVVIQFYVKDKGGNEAFSEVLINKDIYAPIITIETPELGDQILDCAPIFSIIIQEPNLFDFWYSLDNGNTNITLSELIGVIDQEEWDALPDGPDTIRFYAKDKAGNIGTNLVIVIKIITDIEHPSGIPGYDLYLIISVISVISTLIIRKRLKG